MVKRRSKADEQVLQDEIDATLRNDDRLNALDMAAHRQAMDEVPLPLWQRLRDFLRGFTQ